MSPTGITERTATWIPRGPDSEVAVDRAAATANPVIDGRYRLGDLLGVGGMGAVWLAEDELLGRPVALKLVNGSRSAGERPGALREARAAARISHPGVVSVHDVIVDSDRDWIVMEALDGNPLSKLIRERRWLPADHVVRIGLQVLDALEAIHGADLVHRDVKPSNVQICDGGRVVLTDFGLTSSPCVSGGVRVGVVAGSLPYMAPESILDGDFGPASDLFALGVTLYKAVEGHHPFDPVTPAVDLKGLATRTPERGTRAAGLTDILYGLLESDPTRRLDIAGARRQLRSLEHSLPHSWAGTRSLMDLEESA